MVRPAVERADRVGVAVGEYLFKDDDRPTRGLYWTVSLATP